MWACNPKSGASVTNPQWHQTDDVSQVQAVYSTDEVTVQDFLMQGLFISGI